MVAGDPHRPVHGWGHGIGSLERRPLYSYDPSTLP